MLAAQKPHQHTRPGRRLRQQQKPLLVLGLIVGFGLLLLGLQYSAARLLTRLADQPSAAMSSNDMHMMSMQASSCAVQPACGRLSAAACRPVTLTQPHPVVQMTFEASKSVTLWFKQWHTHTWGGYAATCLVLVVICLIHEALTCYRARFHKLYLAEPEYQPLEPGSARGLETGSARGERATPRLGPASHDPAAKERWAACSRSAQLSSPLAASSLRPA